MRKIKPVFGEATLIAGKPCARIRTSSGRTYINTNEGRGFPSLFFALEFVNKTMREGALLNGYARAS